MSLLIMWPGAAWVCARSAVYSISHVSTLYCESIISLFLEKSLILKEINLWCTFSFECWSAPACKTWSIFFCGSDGTRWDFLGFFDGKQMKRTMQDQYRIRWWLLRSCWFLFVLCHLSRHPRRTPSALLSSISSVCTVSCEGNRASYCFSARLKDTILLRAALTRFDLGLSNNLICIWKLCNSFSLRQHSIHSRFTFLFSPMQHIRDSAMENIWKTVNCFTQWACVLPHRTERWNRSQIKILSLFIDSLSHVVSNPYNFLFFPKTDIYIYI